MAEQETLKLIPFQPIPKLDFGSIVIGSRFSERSVLLVNPTAKTIRARLSGSSREFKCELDEISLEPLSSLPLTFTSAPNEIGSFKRTISIRLGNGLSLQIIAFGCCVEEAKKRRRRKPAKPAAVSTPPPRKRSFAVDEDMTPKIVRYTGADGELKLVSVGGPRSETPLKEINQTFAPSTTPPQPPPQPTNDESLEEQTLLCWLNHFFSNPLATDESAEDHCPRQIDLNRSYAHLKSKLTLLTRKPPFSQFVQTESDLKRKLELKPNVYFSFDAGARDLVYELLLSYTPLWFKLAAEILLNRFLSASKRIRPESLKKTISQFVLDDPEISAKFAIPNIARAFKDGHKEAISWHVVWSFFKITHFLDLAKSTDSEIAAGLCLFRSESNVKSTRDVIDVFLRHFVLTNSLTAFRLLTAAGLSTQWTQKPIEEYSLFEDLNDVSRDLKDGIRLARLAEILCSRPKPQTHKHFAIKCPAGSVVFKVQNHRYALDMLASAFSINLAGIDPKMLAVGHRKQLVSLLWRIVFSVEVPAIVNIAQIAKEILFLKKYTQSLQSRPTEQTELRMLKSLFLQSDGEDCDDGDDDDDQDFERSFDAGSKLFAVDNAKHGRWIIGLLFKWAYLVCELRGFKLHNLTSSFSKGLPIYLLISHYRPDLLPAKDLAESTKSDDRQRIAFRFKSVSKALFDIGRVPCFINFRTKLDGPTSVPDQKCTVLQLAFLANRLLEVQNERRSARIIWNAWLKLKARRCIKNVSDKHQRLNEQICSILRESAVSKREALKLNILRFYLCTKIGPTLQSSIHISNSGIGRIIKLIDVFKSIADHHHHKRSHQMKRRIKCSIKLAPILKSRKVNSDELLTKISKLSEIFNSTKSTLTTFTNINAIMNTLKRLPKLSAPPNIDHEFESANCIEQIFKSRIRAEREYGLFESLNNLVGLISQRRNSKDRVEGVWKNVGFIEQAIKSSQRSSWFFAAAQESFRYINTDLVPVLTDTIRLRSNEHRPIFDCIAKISGLIKSDYSRRGLWKIIRLTTVIESHVQTKSDLRELTLVHGSVNRFPSLPKTTTIQSILALSRIFQRNTNHQNVMIKRATELSLVIAACVRTRNQNDLTAKTNLAVERILEWLKSRSNTQSADNLLCYARAVYVYVGLLIGQHHKALKSKQNVESASGASRSQIFKLLIQSKRRRIHPKIMEVVEIVKNRSVINADQHLFDASQFLGQSIDSVIKTRNRFDRMLELTRALDFIICPLIIIGQADYSAINGIIDCIKSRRASTILRENTRSICWFRANYIRVLLQTTTKSQTEWSDYVAGIRKLGNILCPEQSAVIDSTVYFKTRQISRHLTESTKVSMAQMFIDDRFYAVRTLKQVLKSRKPKMSCAYFADLRNLIKPQPTTDIANLYPRIVALSRLIKRPGGISDLYRRSNELCRLIRPRDQAISGWPNELNRLLGRPHHHHHMEINELYLRINELTRLIRPYDSDIRDLYPIVHKLTFGPGDLSPPCVGRISLVFKDVQATSRCLSSSRSIVASSVKLAKLFEQRSIVLNRMELHSISKHQQTAGGYQSIPEHADDCDSRPSSILVALSSDSSLSSWSSQDSMHTYRDENSSDRSLHSSLSSISVVDDLNESHPLASREQNYALVVLNDLLKSSVRTIIAINHFAHLNHYASIIQRTYRTFVVQSNKFIRALDDTTNLTKRSVQSCEIVDERHHQTLGLRFAKAIDALKSSNDLYVVHRASGELALATAWSSELSIRLAQSKQCLDIIMDVLANCNRSFNHGLVIQCISTLLLNICLCSKSIVPLNHYMSSRLDSDKADPEHNCVLFLVCLLVRHSKNLQALALFSALLGKMFRHRPALAKCLKNNSFWSTKLDTVKKQINCCTPQTSFTPVALDPAWALKSTQRMLKTPIEAYNYLMKAVGGKRTK